MNNVDETLMIEKKPRKAFLKALALALKPSSSKKTTQALVQT